MECSSTKLTRPELTTTELTLKLLTEIKVMVKVDRMYPEHRVTSQHLMHQRFESMNLEAMWYSDPGARHA